MYSLLYSSLLRAIYKSQLTTPFLNPASYGSLARFTDVKRLRVFLDSSVVGLEVVGFVDG